MKWCEAYIQMKDNKAFVRRDSWGHKYFIWLKPSVNVKLEWCKDELLKKVIEHFGHTLDGQQIIKAEDALCLYNGYSVETGFKLRPEDKVADDWSVVKFD